MNFHLGNTISKWSHRFTMRDRCPAFASFKMFNDVNKQYYPSWEAKNRIEQTKEMAIKRPIATMGYTSSLSPVILLSTVVVK